MQSTFVVVREEYGSETELVLHTAVCSGSLGLACDSERVDVWIAVCLACMAEPETIILALFPGL